MADQVQYVRRFAAKRPTGEDGSMTILTVMLLSMMLIFGGIAVDIMRFETNRARLQATLDRSVLAAADLSVCLDPSQDTEAIVEDYIEKAGFADELEEVTVVQSANSCAVSATASLEVDTIFFSNVGIDTLSTGAGSAATESLSDAEISLVVDISGSMGWDGRIEALRPAAVEFVNTVFDSFEPGSVSMSLVPYSTQVNVGEDILDAFPGMNRYHNYSHCANLTSAMYDEVGFDMATSIDQTAHFDADSYSYNRSYWGASRFVCNPDPNSEVIAHAHEPGMLTTRINQLQPYEWTSIEMGAKWGLALLDPSTADITAYLESQGVVDQLVDDRPLEYGGDSMKVMVLMTDGENTQSYELDPPYRTGLSDVYIDDDTGLYYVEDEEQGNKDWDGSYWEDWYRPDYDNWTNGIPWDARQLTWPELFDRINVDGHAWYFRAEQYGSGHNFNSWYSGIFETTYSSTKNTRLLALCDLAKEQGIVIFTIGFQVPAAADTVMESCASSPSYYYDVDDLDIDEAFTSIATQISALRLIQ